MIEMSLYPILEILRDHEGLTAGEISTKLNGRPLEQVRDELDAAIMHAWVAKEPARGETGEGLPLYRLTRVGKTLIPTSKRE